MSDNNIYSCTREVMEDRADKGQVAPALHAVFLQLHRLHCRYLLLSPEQFGTGESLLHVTLLSEAYWELLSSLLRC